MCKPCISDNIVIAEKPGENNAAPVTQLRILPEEPEVFTLKAKYMFTVTVKSRLQAGQPVQEAVLIRYVKLRH